MPPATPLPATWTPRTRSTVQRALLAWFDTHRRNLPWRENRDPYRIWVSEVMLQQTTVTAVIPYFERFLVRFPTVTDLAQADEQEVLRYWSGLGYYRRARHLHQAAQRLAGQHGNTLPDDPAFWAGLPGVGQYILGAVLSQAFDRRLPIVEANSLRVLARLWAYPDDPRTGAGKKWVWLASETLLPARRVGDFNQALMELGALVCRVESPQCERCPVAQACRSRQLGLQGQVPQRVIRPKALSVEEVAVVIRDRERVLLCQRPETATRWANLWEFPHAERQPAESWEQAASRIARELTGVTITPVDEMMTIRHSVTQSSIRMVCVDAIRTGGAFEIGHYAAGKWLSGSELSQHPTSSPQKKLIGEVVKRFPIGSVGRIPTPTGGVRKISRS